MTIVLTNDDGIDAPGIDALQQAIAEDNLIVAPKYHLSGCGHQVTTNRPLELEQRSARAYAVDGTPADCTRIALNLCDRIDWVISGINAGGNLGVDVYISGTVAAAREAAIHNIPAVAISHWIRRPMVIDWQWASRWANRVFQKLFDHPLPPKSFWNVNLPHLEPDSPDPEIVFCPLSNDPLPVNYQVEDNLHYYHGEYSKRDRTDGTDVDVCFSGNIAVSLIKL